MGKTRYKKSTVYGNGLGVINDSGNTTEVVNKDSLMLLPKVVQSTRFSATVTQVNAANGTAILPAVAGKKYRIVDITMIAIGGNASGATTVDILGKQTTVKKLLAGAVGGLTQNTILKPDTATHAAVLADGASFVACDAGEPVSISKTGSALATATHIDVILSYVLE